MPNKGGKGASGRLTPKQQSQRQPQANTQAMSAADFLAQLGNGGANYAQQAQDIYAPQFDYLNQQGSQIRGNYAQGDQKLQQLYANLVQSINGDRGAIRSDYGGAINASNANTRAGLGAIEGHYDQSQSEAAKLLQSLGISDTVGYALGSSDRDKNAFEAALASNGAAYGNQLNSERTSSLEYNRDQANISKQIGTEKRAGLQSDLQKALAALAAQRAQLQSQERSQEYSMQSNAASQAYKQQQDQIANELALKKLELQYGPKAGQSTLKGPIGALATEAGQLYPNENAAQNAIKAVTDTLATYGNKTPNNVNDFVQAVLHRNPHATDVANLTDLAQLLFKQLNFSNSALY
jgi:hypothetical protein